jgi:hypothetical protein
LARSQQVGDLGCGEDLEFGQSSAVFLSTIEPCPLQLRDIQPDLLTGLVKETP